MSFKIRKFFVVLAGIAMLALAPQQQAEANPRYAALVVDAKTGKTLFSRYADAQRYPASLTKMMTLYVLFEEIEAGRLSLNSQLKVSARAAARPPTKIGVKSGGTIRAETAIRALAVRSANDVAVVIAENISGSESKFAQRMTLTARAIGMSKTTFKNASGLPNSKQVTTARDMALLGRALKDRFPSYFKYFSTRSFTYGGRTYRNTNRLLGAVNGVNGIKTGYTRASGFNLVTSVQRDGRDVVAVVMGGRSGASRNAHMIDLIKTHTKRASRGKRTAPLLIAGTGYVAPVPPMPQAKPVFMASAPAVTAATVTPAAAIAAAVPSVPAEAAPVPTARVASAPPVAPAPIVVASAAPTAIAPLPYAKTQARVPVAQAPIARLVKTSTIVPGAALTSVVKPAAAPNVASTVAAVQPEPPAANQANAPSTNLSAAADASQNDPIAARIFAANEVAELAYMGGTPKAETIAQIAKMSVGGNGIGKTNSEPTQIAVEAQPRVLQPQAAPVTASTPATIQAITPKTVSTVAVAPAPAPVPVPIQASVPIQAAPPKVRVSPPGWHIQIGAMPTEDDALQLIAKAKSKANDVVASVDPFTMEVDKDGRTLYRARFAGFSGKKEARAACVRLKKRSFECLAVPN